MKSHMDNIIMLAAGIAAFVGAMFAGSAAGQPGQTPPEAKHVPGYIRDLGDPDPRVRERAADMLAIIGLAVALAVTGHIPGEELGRVIQLVVAFGWWTAGVHFDRSFLWLGGMMAVGLVGTLIFEKYAWTGLGIAVAGVLTVIALRQGRTHVAEAE